jgi:hypothetical protein
MPQVGANAGWRAAMARHRAGRVSRSGRAQRRIFFEPRAAFRQIGGA